MPSSYRQERGFTTSIPGPGGAFLLELLLIRVTGGCCTRLMNFIRDEYRARGYQEVITPQVFNKELWETSGHWQNYREDMFSVNAASHAQGHACANAHGDNNEVAFLFRFSSPPHLNQIYSTAR